MTKAYSYIRMSTLQQLRGASLSRQLEATKKFANERGWELETSLRDIGISAYRGKHAEKGALGKFLKACEEGRIEAGSVLIIENFDRLTRQALLDAIDLFLRILRSGIGIATMSDQQIYTTDVLNREPYKIYQTIGQLTRAHQESEYKSDRVADAWKKKRDAIGTKPYTRRAPAWLKATGSVRTEISFEPIPERAEVVRRIFRMMDMGMGNYTIAQQLNKEGVPTFGSGRNWGNSSIQKLANNEAVIGVFQPHTKRDGVRRTSGPPIENYYPRIIDEDLYLRVQAAREQRKIRRRGPKGKTFNNLFVGIAKCNLCGSTMGYEDKGPPPKGGRYLHCRQAKLGACKNGYYYVYNHVEEDVLGHVEELDFSRVFPDRDNSIHSITRKIRDTQLAYDERNKRRKALLRKFSIEDDPVLEDLIMELKAEAAEIHTKLTNLKKQLAAERAGGANPQDRATRIKRLKSELAAANEQELYQLRAALSDEISTVIKEISFTDFGDFIIHFVDSENTLLVAYDDGDEPEKVEFLYDDEGNLTGTKEHPYRHAWLDEG